MNDDDVSLVDISTTYIILQDKIYFLNLTLMNVNLSTIYGTINLVEGFERANIMLRNRTIF